MIEALKDFPANVVAFIGRGQITKHDYTTVLIPVVQEALKTQDKVRLYYEIGTDFAGFDAGALWEDAKLGVGHLRRWERAAVVTDVGWIKLAAGAIALLSPMEAKIFSTNEASKARGWIVGP